MAFNQGPQPEIVLNTNGVRYVDPNPTDEIVNHEDLVMYVKLVARSKGRSILTYNEDSEQTTVIAERRNVKSETNFTYPNDKDYIDTSWTNIGGGNLNFGEDLGSFGITNINIEFKSSFMPQIVIDFVDVRGSALFEQGPCSPYAVFFHLPYPVFELTVKGYYGRPVTYTLALVKFNTKFNSETGNFESKAEFVGYTYAFLADIPMGYIMAANYMTKPHNGSEILAKKWQQLIDKKILDESSFTDIKKPLSIHDLIKNAKKLEQRTAELKNSEQIKNLGKVTSTKSQLDDLRSGVVEFEGKLKECVGKSGNGGIEGKNVFFLKLPKGTDPNTSDLWKKVNEVIEKYVGKDTNIGGIIGAKLSAVESYYSTNSIEGKPTITLDNLKKNTKGFLSQAKVTEGELDKYSIDLYESFYKFIDISNTDLSKQQVNKKESVRTYLNGEVQKTLGFLPTVSNVFAIILTNVEVFLELLLLTSRDAEKYHEENDVTTGLGGGSGRKILDLKDTSTIGAQLSDNEASNQPNKVYPWPTYYEEKNSTTGDAGSKETYPGENPDFVSWPEVVFVENFIKALTRLKTELEVLELQKENLPGYDNFAPITAYETHGLGNNDAPNRWYRLQQVDGGDWAKLIYKIMGENAFIIGDYTMINSLSVWKSQLGFRNGWGVQTLTNYTGSQNGYTPAPAGFDVGPQRLKDNPSINLNIEDLNRYPGAKTNEFEYKSGPGFHFQGSDSDDKVESFKRKIVPTTLSKMKKWGYIDALNLMTTLKLDGEKGDIFGHLSNNFIQANKATIIKGIKDALGERFKNEKFNQWAISATQEIGGDPKLITQQSIWDGKFRYVQLKDVYTLKGPITLNEQVDGGNIKIHANPHKNLGEGAVLTTADNLTAREINFTSESLPQEIKDAYTKKYADITDIESKPLESKTPEPEALAYTLLKYRPKTAVNSPNTAYVNQTLFRSDVNLTRDKNTNMLSLGTYFYPNFYHTYEKNSDLSNSEAILDLSSSRRYIGEDNEWASFIGAPPKNGSGWANSIINTPLWTLNYPLYKNTWNYSFGGDKGYIGLDEVISTKDGKFVANGDNISKGYLNNIDSNTRRNWSTWWGLNQWGVDDASDYYLPLAYMAVMSFGFQHPKLEYMTGHFVPWDGNGDYDLSSFSNFTSTAIVANLPKSYVLLIGAILWRMKETNLLRWDKNENGEGILPKRNAINTDNKGWNWLNASFLGGSNNQPGIDDLNDPVWFFHTSTSKPKYVGGSVYAIPEGNPGFTIEANSSNHGSYERRWKGAYGGGESDRWTNGGGSIAQGFTLSNPVLIGKKQSLNTANINVTSHSDTEGWTKGQLSTLTVDSNKARGYYDMCRADQVPFLMNYFNDDFKRPRTLVITSLSKKEKKYDKDNKTPNLHESYYPVLLMLLKIGPQGKIPNGYQP